MELIIVIVIIGILAVISIPKYQDFQRSARIAATQGSLGSLRSVFSMKYADSVSKNPGAVDHYSNVTFNASDFANNQLPINSLTGYVGVNPVSKAPSGTSPSPNGTGFWYVNAGADERGMPNNAAGRIGAYSDGLADTSKW